MYRKYIKRILDIIISLLALPIFVIIYIIVAPCILISDGRPIFYSANRIGKNGKLYKMYKFRSMMNNAPDIRLKDGSTFNSENDPRVTKIGKVLRKTSLDETPQMINVLLGDSGIIGTTKKNLDFTGVSLA